MGSITKRGIARTGVVLTAVVFLYLLSLEICAELGISNPLDDDVISPMLFLASPLFLAFQILAVVMTNRSDFTGRRRVATYMMNGLGTALAFWMAMMLFMMWRR